MKLLFAAGRLLARYDNLLAPWPGFAPFEAQNENRMIFSRLEACNSFSANLSNIQRNVSVMPPARRFAAMLC